MRKELGKITSVKFGLDGYQEAMLGISFQFEMGNLGCCDFEGYWDPETIACSPQSKWTEEDRDKRLANTMRYISKLLKDAKVKSVEELKGKPVELTFDLATLVSWRILTEVL